MNSLLYGLPDLKGMAQDMKEMRETCPECKGYGRIIYYADTGEKISEEQFKADDDSREMTIAQCPKCEGTGFLNFFIEEPNPLYY